MPTATEATSALNSRIDAVTSQLQSMRGRTPTVRSVEQLRSTLDRLDNGLNVAQAVLQIEADAGRLATAEYRALEAAFDRGSDVSGVVSVRLNETLSRLGLTLSVPAAVGTSTTATSRPDMDFSRTAQRAAGSMSIGWVLASGAAALGLGWGVLHFLGKKRSA